MRIREIMEEKEWEQAVKNISFRPFTQSFVWGEFQKSLGKKIKRLYIEHDGALQALCQIQFEPRPFVGGYWFAPKGPVFSAAGARNAEQVLQALRAFASKNLQEAVFLRLEPMILSMALEIPSGWERKTSLNPSSTRRLDLHQTEKEILEGMHQKTRYNIRISEKKNVKTHLGSKKDLGDFLDIMKETAARGQFTQHDDAYLKKTFAFLSEKNIAKLRLASFEKKMIAGQIEIWSGDTVTYLYGASSSSMRSLMAPYALHWAAIQEAKEAKMHWYDFWGENPEDEASIDYKKSWKGISRYKKGFGGEHLEYIGTIDTPIRKTIYRILRRLRRI